GRPRLPARRTQGREIILKIASTRCLSDAAPGVRATTPVPVMDSSAPTPAPSNAPPPHQEPEPPLPPTRWQRLKRALLGGPKDIQDPLLFQHISLAAFLAWVGLGADGLSSSAYGPEEAFKNLGEHQYLAVFLALATGLTVLIISAAYTKIIEHFPFGSVGLHLGRVGDVARSIETGLHTDLSTMGAMALALLFLRAYSLGAGTYTGIEAVSNGLSIMREPRVATAKRTMVYMATSLAVTAGGIILGYLLMGVRHIPGKTMNWTLAYMLAVDFHLLGIPIRRAFVVVTLASEALLLFVAAQAGFIAGPRVMANMAHDSWLPHRLSALSDRLTMQNGVLLMGIASLFMLLYTRGSVDALVVMYSINVFVTFALSQAGMIRYWLRRDTQLKYANWRSSMALAAICFVVCTFILLINVYEKFFE